MASLAQRLADSIETPRTFRTKAHAWRIATLVGTLLLLALVPWNLDPVEARRIGIAILLLVGAASIAGTVAAQRILRQIRIAGLSHTAKAASGTLLAIRGIGISLLGLTFFLCWMGVYMILWSVEPAACSSDIARSCDAAFRGLGNAPTVGDFLMYTVNMAFVNPLPDIIAASRTARALSTIEVVCGVALVTLYARSFWGTRPTESA